MKKLLPAFAITVIAGLALYSCSLLQTLQKVKEQGYYCYNYNDVAVNEMDKNSVLQMISNYYQKQYAAISNANISFSGGPAATKKTGEDSRAVFFNLDTLKRLIFYIEKGTENFSPSDRQNLGINIYFGSYPAHLQVQKHGYDYTNRHTLIFLPAIFDNDNHTARDFNLKNSLSGINIFSPQYFTESILNGSTSLIGLAAMPPPPTAGAENMFSQNHGTATPPPPAPTTNPILERTNPN